MILSCESFCHFFRNGKMGHFEKKSKPYMVRKLGHFDKNARDQFENRKRTENEILRFLGISKKWQKLSHDKIVLGAFPTFWGIS